MTVVIENRIKSFYKKPKSTYKISFFYAIITYIAY